MKPGEQQDIIIPFGIHKDKLVADTPNSYLEFLMEQDWFCSKFKDVAEQIKIEQDYRKKFNIIIE